MGKVHRQNESASKSLLLGTFLLSLFFFALFDTTLLFMLGVSISDWNLLLAIICSGLVCFYLSKCSVKETIQIIIFGLMILGVTALLSTYVYERACRAISIGGRPCYIFPMRDILKSPVKGIMCRDIGKRSWHKYAYCLNLT